MAVYISTSHRVFHKATRIDKQGPRLLSSPTGGLKTWRAAGLSCAAYTRDSIKRGDELTDKETEENAEG